MFQPNLQKKKIIPILLSTLAIVTIGFAPAVAVDEPGSSATPSPTATTTPTETPTPTATPSPEVTIPIEVPSWNIDSAKSLQVVVNKKRPLNPKTYAPVLDKALPLAKPAADAYRKIKKEITNQKLGTLCLNSGYRSFKTQTATHAYQVARGKQFGYDGETVAARPSYSEHQTGLAVDVSLTSVGCSINKFGATKASSWLAKNAWQYGFIIRYPKGKEKITGYIYEPWHLRFVGVELATDMRAKKIATLEEFFELPAATKY